MALSGHADPAAVLGTTIAFSILAFLAVLLRMYSRLVLVRSAGRDDIFICIAVCMSIGQTIAQCYQVKYGMGRHISSLSPYEQITSLKPFWASIVIYNLGLFFTKFSILLQYLRIFPHKLFRRLCWTLMAFLFVWSCWTVFSAIFFCTPVAKFWQPGLDGWCFSEWAIWFSNAGVNILSDMAVATLPLPFLSQLQLPKRQRYALMTVFALGGFTCIISILRLESLLVFLNTDDISWNNPLAAIWSSVEVNTGILCSCLPTLKSLLTWVWPRALGGTGNRTPRGGRGYYGNGYAGQGGYGDDTRKSAPSTHQSHRPGHTAKLSFDALGRGLTGRDVPLQRTYVASGNHASTNNKGGSADGSSVDSGSPGSGDGRGEIGIAQGGEVEEGIQVVTVVEQAVERGSLGGRKAVIGGGEGLDDGRSDSESTRELVPQAGRGTGQGRGRSFFDA